MTTELLRHDEEDVLTIQKLLEAPVYLSADYLRQNILPTVTITIVAVTCVFLAALPLAKRARETTTAATTEATKKRLENDRLLAYQMTNAVANTLLGMLGVYFQYIVLPQKDAIANATSHHLYNKIQGHEDDLYLLGSIQIGYQLWSIVVGTIWVPEPTVMLAHHFAAILASSKGCFLTNGFRWYAPMALGMLELSSVPLSVMNAFKNNPEWIERYPSIYQASRLVFSFVFLFIRIGLFVPQHVKYLRIAFLTAYHAKGLDHVGNGYLLWMSLEWLGAVFLLFLQMYWGWLIANGLAKFASGKIQIKGKILEAKKTN